MFSYWAKPKDTLEVCKMLNDHIAEICKKYPKRFGKKKKKFKKKKFK